MLWSGIYLIVAALVAIATFAAADWLREGHIAAPDYPGVMSAVAGILWPVLLVGISEIMVLSWAYRAARPGQLDLLPAG